VIVSPEEKDKRSCPSTAGGLPLTRKMLTAQSVATVGLLRGDDSVAGPGSAPEGAENDEGEGHPPMDGARALTPPSGKSG
jgi:hypothetical protein